MRTGAVLVILISCLHLLLITDLYGQIEILWTDDFSDGEYTDNPPWWIWEDEDANKAGKARVEDGELILYEPNPVFNPAFNLIWTGGDTLNHRYTRTDFYLTCKMMMTANGDPYNSEMPHIYTRASLDARVWYVVIFAPRGSQGAGIYIYTYVGTVHFVADPLVQPGTSFNVALKVEADTINCSVYQGPFPPEEWELTYVLPEANHVEPEEAVALLTLGGWYLDELHIDDVVYWSVSEETGVNTTVSSSTPDAISLLQNYPNPFNSDTEIRYHIPDVPSLIPTTLKIYSILGQETKTLIESPHQTGHFTTSWNGRDNFGSEVASGVYFYRLTAGEYCVTKKMILLK